MQSENHRCFGGWSQSVIVACLIVAFPIQSATGEAKNLSASHVNSPCYNVNLNQSPALKGRRLIKYLCGVDGLRRELSASEGLSIFAPSEAEVHGLRMTSRPGLTFFFVQKNNQNKTYSVSATKFSFVSDLSCLHSIPREVIRTKFKSIPIRDSLLKSSVDGFRASGEKIDDIDVIADISSRKHIILRFAGDQLVMLTADCLLEPT
jgi:hypothetical protein